MPERTREIIFHILLCVIPLAALSKGVVAAMLSVMLVVAFDWMLKHSFYSENRNKS